MPKGTNEVNQVKEQWNQKIHEILQSEADKRFANFPVSVSFTRWYDVKFLRFQGSIYFIVERSVGAQTSAHLFKFDSVHWNEKYLKACADEMLKDVPKQLLDFAKTIIKLNEKGGKVEESAA